MTETRCIVMRANLQFYKGLSKTFNVFTNVQNIHFFRDLSLQKHFFKANICLISGDGKTEGNICHENDKYKAKLLKMYGNQYLFLPLSKLYVLHTCESADIFGQSPSRPLKVSTHYNILNGLLSKRAPSKFPCFSQHLKHLRPQYFEVR